MTHFEYMESIGQITIFDFLEVTPSSVRNKEFFEGDKVKIRFYEDEIDFIRKCHPQLMKLAEVIGMYRDFYIIRIDEISLHVEGEKLILV